MRALLLVVLFSFCCFATYAQTQMDMNESAGKDFEKADKELNRIYQQILKNNADDTAFINNLKIAQRIWIQFRDAEMKMKYPDRPDGYYGSVFPMCWELYLTQLTDERIKTLKEWIIGEEEGDVCGGTVPVKQTKR